MTRTVKLAAFNIVTHPHSADDYADLFRKARSLRQAIKVWGETHAILATAHQPRAEEKSSQITGEIFTFLHLDPTLGWFDILKGEEATDQQIDEVKIPTELRPHLKKIRYVLFPKEHIFVYTLDDSHRGKISPTAMKNFLERLLNDNRLLEKTQFQEVEVRLVQDSRELEAILETLSIEKLEIVVRLPNPGDTPGDAEKMVEKEMDDEHLEEIKILKKSSSNSEIKPNQRTKNYMKVAATNGYVKAKGITVEGKPREYNTQESALIEPFEFSDQTPYLERFLDAARKLVDIIRGRK